MFSMIVQILMGLIPLLFLLIISIYKKRRTNVLSKISFGEICSMCKKDLHKNYETYIIYSMDNNKFEPKVCESCKRCKRLAILKGKIYQLHYNIKEFFIFEYFKYMRIVMFWYMGIMLITILLMIFTEISNLIYIVGITNIIVWSVFFYREKLISIKK